MVFDLIVDLLQGPSGPFIVLAITVVAVLALGNPLKDASRKY